MSTINIYNLSPPHQSRAVTVAYLWKITLYNPTVDIINVNVYTNFGCIVSIAAQDMSRTEILTSIKGCNPIASLQKMMLYHPNIDLITYALLMCIQNLVQFRPFILKILSGTEILTSMKGHYSVANLPKMTLFNPNVINVNVYTKFCKILSIHSKDIKRKRNSDINQGL